MSNSQDIKSHYYKFWGAFTEHTFTKGSVNELPANFKILKFAPGSSRNMWTYATCGMSDYPNASAIELYGLISLPYLDGSCFENHQIKSGLIRFLWLIPITIQERDYKKQNGLEALEQKFEQGHLNYINPYRKSVVADRF